MMFTFILQFNDFSKFSFSHEVLCSYRPRKGTRRMWKNADIGRQRFHTTKVSLCLSDMRIHKKDDYRYLLKTIFVPRLPKIHLSMILPFSIYGSKVWVGYASVNFNSHVLTALGVWFSPNFLCPGGLGF